MTWYALLGAVEQGFVYGIMALGVYLTFRVLDFPDLTVDGSLPLGASVSAVAITHGYKLDGKLTEKTVEMNKPGDYTVDCPGKVENVFIRIAKPSTK